MKKAILVLSILMMAMSAQARQQLCELSDQQRNAESAKLTELVIPYISPILQQQRGIKLIQGLPVYMGTDEQSAYMLGALTEKQSHLGIYLVRITTASTTSSSTSTDPLFSNSANLLLRGVKKFDNEGNITRCQDYLLRSQVQSVINSDTNDPILDRINIDVPGALIFEYAPTVVNDRD